MVANNAKLYVNRADGFLGMGLKKDELVQDCSDIDDIIIFRRDGVMKVVKIDDKTFVGKDIIHIAVWKKNDERTTYNMAYIDGKSGRTMAKRFNVTAITRDKEYALASDAKGSKVLYFTANPNGESEVVNVILSPGSTAKIKNFDFDFGELAIKGREAQGNILTKYPVKQIRQKEVGKSTIGAQRFWYDEITGRLNTQERGGLLGEFDTGDNLLIVYNNGSYEITDTDVQQRFEPKDILYLVKFDPEQIINAVHFDGIKGWTMVKRFRIETNKLRERYSFLTDHPKSKILFTSLKANPRIRYTLKVKGKAMSGEVNLGEFMDPKGWKAVGNKLSDQALSQVREVEGPSPKPEAQQPELFAEPVEAKPTTPSTPAGTGAKKPVPEKTTAAKPEKKEGLDKTSVKKTFKPGDTIEFD